MRTRRQRRSKASCTVGSENVYRDLGFPDADEILAKAKLASTLSELIAQNSWSVPFAAARLKCSRRDLTAILRGQFRQISARELAAIVGLVQADGVAAEGPRRSEG
jgi:hypothetical protein